MDPPASCRRLLCRRQPRPAIVIQRVVDRELQFHVVEVVPRDGLKPGRHRIQARGFWRELTRLLVDEACDEPGACDAIDARLLSGDPFHGTDPFRGVAPYGFALLVWPRAALSPWA